MSTYYCLACDVHREAIDFWARQPAGAHLCEDPEVIQEFLETHVTCGINVLSEHDDRFNEYSPERFDA